MDRRSPDTDDWNGGGDRGPGNGVPSVWRTALVGVLLVSIGGFGLGMVWLTATAVDGGTATWITFVAGLFGVATTAFAGYELYHLGRRVSRT